MVLVSVHLYVYLHKYLTCATYRVRAKWNESIISLARAWGFKYLLALAHARYGISAYPGIPYLG